MLISTINGKRGFTLIELLVVVLLLGLGLSVSLTLDFAASPQQQKQQTQLLANSLELAAQDAVLDDAVLGLDFFATADQFVGWRWMQLREGEWQLYPLRDADEEEAVLPAELSATLSLGGQTLVPEPQADPAAVATFAPEILVLPTRELTPFTLTLTGAAGGASVLTADLMGRVRVDEDAPTPP